MTCCIIPLILLSLILATLKLPILIALIHGGLVQLEDRSDAEVLAQRRAHDESSPDAQVEDLASRIVEGDLS